MLLQCLWPVKNTLPLTMCQPPSPPACGLMCSWTGVWNATADCFKAGTVKWVCQVGKTGLLMMLLCMLPQQLQRGSCLLLVLRANGGVRPMQYAQAAAVADLAGAAVDFSQSWCPSLCVA